MAAHCNGRALNYLGGMRQSPSDASIPAETRVLDATHTGAAELACSNTSLRRAARRLGQLYDDAIAPSGLTSPQALLLAQIDALGGEFGSDGPPLQVLATRLAVSISAVTHALRPLLRNGLVELRPDARDRRIKHAGLTTLGRERYRTMYALRAEANRRVETVLGAGSAETLRRLADAVASDAFLEAYASHAKLSI